MRRYTLLTSLIISLCPGAFAQGRILMVNDSTRQLYFGALVNPADVAYVNQPIPATLPSGVTLRVDLYGGTSAGNMTLQMTTTIGAASPGLFGPVTFTSPNLVGGQTATMQIKVRDASYGTAELAQASGAYNGFSQIFTFKPSSTIAPNAITNTGGTALSTWAAGPILIGWNQGYYFYFSSQPSNTSVMFGSNVTLSAAVQSPYQPTYQWWKDGSPITGATNNFLTFTNAVATNAGNYFIVAKDYYQFESKTSVVATLTILIPASIGAGPSNQVVAAHETGMFSVNASGNPAPNFRWLFNGIVIPGANSNSLVIPNVGTNQLGYYSIEVWNAYGAVTSAPVALLMSPSLHFPFAGLVAIWGREAALSVLAWGSADLSYQWYKDGQSVFGATNRTLVFPGVQVGDAGFYSVVVSSPYGSVSNTPAQLVINPANVSLGLNPNAVITIEGVPGYTYGIEYTTDLQNTNSWQSLTNITLTQPVEIWVDTNVNVTTSARRFYRVTSQ